MTLRPLLVALAGVLCLAAPLPAAEPPNLDHAKQELTRYIASGEYGKKLADVALRANRYLTQRVARAKPGEKLAVVFDIDETTLSNLTQMQAYGFGYHPRTWDEWVNQSRASAIIPVQTVYENATRLKAAVFFISGRNERQRASTEKNLRDVGYDTWARIYLLPADSQQPLRLFKVERRRQIEADGYTIIANIGDQDGDLVGGHAEKTFKLPNPFYLTH